MQFLLGQFFQGIQGLLSLSRRQPIGIDIPERRNQRVIRG